MNPELSFAAVYLALGGVITLGFGIAYLVRTDRVLELLAGLLALWLATT